VAKLFGSNQHDKAADSFYDSGTAKLCPPDNSAHISSRNAVPSDDSAIRVHVARRFRTIREDQLDESLLKSV
jgi:hypothetical protein